jgi:hypothetical protein
MNTNKPFNRDPFDRAHGSLYDRGSADSYYGRPRHPHWWPHGTNKGYMLLAKTEAEIAEYAAGFRDNEAAFFKDWG